jgi:hypothetical protein
MLAVQPDHLLRPTRLNHGTGLGTEGTLRVAAEMLSNSRLDEVTAMTVVGILGQDDAARFEALVADIADEFGLETRTKLHVGTFSVRFSRGLPD